MKRFFTWLLLTVVIQGMIYLYLDRFVLLPSVPYSQHTVSSERTLPGGAANYSHDRSYYAVVSGKKIGFYKTSDRKLLRQVKLGKGESLSYFSWLPDRNIALLGINQSEGRGSSVLLKQVDLETNSHPIEPRIGGLKRGARISGVAYSPETNVIYLLVKNGLNSAVFRTDANNHLQSVQTGSLHIGRIACLTQRDLLLFDSLDSNSVYALDFIKGKRERISPDDSRYVLIGVDMNDRIYIGRLNQNRLIEAIYMGEYPGEFREYRKLGYPYPRDSIKVTYNGRLLFT